MSRKYNWDYLLSCVKEDNIINFHKKIEEEVYIFGASLAGEKVRRSLEGIATVSAFIDNDVNKIHTIINGVKVIGIKERDVKSRQIIIASQWYKEIIKQLNDEEFYNYIVYPFELFEWDDYKIVKEFENPDVVARYKTVYDALSDDESKEAYVRMLAYRATGNREHIKISDYDQYCHPSIKNNSVNTVIDAGAYDGDTIEQFSREFLNLNHLYAFEPTEEKIAQIKERIGVDKENKKYSDITLINKGLWSTSTTLKFQTSDSASMTNKVSETGEITIPVVSLDEFASELDIDNKIDFIKMDIEGSEVEALKGGERLIKRNQPILAISIYHDVTHFWQVFDVIEQFGLSYKYFVGHHKSVLFDTVLYALPSNK